MQQGTTQMMLTMVAGAMIALLPPDVSAQTVRRDVIGCGGAAMAGSLHMVTGTAGQPAIGPIASTTVNDLQGFWYGVPQAVGPSAVAIATGSEHHLSIAPNPVATTGTLMLSLASRRLVRLRLVDMLGRETVLLDGSYGPGRERIVLDVGHLPVGRYILLLDGAGGYAHADLLIVR